VEVVESERVAADDLLVLGLEYVQRVLKSHIIDAHIWPSASHTYRYILIYIYIYIYAKSTYIIDVGHLIAVDVHVAKDT
jgi:hypothetical protein